MPIKATLAERTLARLLKELRALKCNPEVSPIGSPHLKNVSVKLPNGERFEITIYEAQRRVSATWQEVAADGAPVQHGCLRRPWSEIAIKLAAQYALRVAIPKT